MSFMDAFLIGVAQVLSVIPGTSRSDITMTCARGRGFKREESARFSMLLSIPTILLAGIYTIWKASSGQMIMPPSQELAVALVSSAIFGMIAITFLIKWLNKASFFVFGVYRIILGICVLIYFL
jgi:undecaprenyl-diphosphatase